MLVEEGGFLEVEFPSGEFFLLEVENNWKFSPTMDQALNSMAISWLITSLNESFSISFKTAPLFTAKLRSGLSTVDVVLSLNLNNFPMIAIDTNIKLTTQVFLVTRTIF